MVSWTEFMLDSVDRYKCRRLRTGVATRIIERSSWIPAWSSLKRTHTFRPGLWEVRKVSPVDQSLNQTQKHSAKLHVGPLVLSFNLLPRRATHAFHIVPRWRISVFVVIARANFSPARDVHIFVLDILKLPHCIQSTLRRLCYRSTVMKRARSPSML